MELVVLVGILMVLLSCTPVFEARVRAPERPVVPNVTATSPTEIKMSWCRVKPNKIEIDHYELYIDNELEYSGIDVMYVAKRLKPWTWYEVKLRSCGFQPGFSCSQFSRPILVKTLADNENTTAIPSTAAVFKTVVLPTYMFIAGVLVGVVILAMALVWRYLQSNDSWMNEPAFELPTHVQSHERACLKGKITKLNLFQLSDLVGAKKDAGKSVKKAELSAENGYQQIAGTEEGVYSEKNSMVDFVPQKQEPAVQAMEESLSVGGLVTVQDNGTLDKYAMLSSDKALLTSMTNSHSDGPVVRASNPEIKSEEDDNRRDSPFIFTVEKSNAENTCINSFQQQTISKSDKKPSEPELSTMQQEVDQLNDFQINETASSSAVNDDETRGAVIVVDNSNIYIGAQECASAINAGERKRHVRVKLQNLVKILEKNRAKERTFVCGSSPPATEHVWDVYRHLGYVVDLEDRRGKDEQRVDEGLHLFIYKAICELPPRVLVLASGDGMKGKSENSTSFPGCAMMALERGWHVEVYSWKHSLSTEWHKLAKKYPEHLTINYLDKYVNHITFVDGKHGRKCLPITGPLEKDRTGGFESRPGRLSYHNG